MILSNPPSYLVANVENPVWQAFPFQSPLTGFGSIVTSIPKSSAILYNIYLAIHN